MLTMANPSTTFSFCSFRSASFCEFMLTWHVNLDNFTFLVTEYELLLLAFLGSPFHDFNNSLLFFSTYGLDLVTTFFSLFLLSHQLYS
jgi:hypothetical protein